LTYYYLFWCSNLKDVLGAVVDGSLALDTAADTVADTLAILASKVSSA
jgi:hypothetical protein